MLIIIGAVGSYFNSSVDCVSANYGKNALLFLIDALAGSIGLILFFIALEKKIPPLEFFGKNSLIVLCTHMFIVNLFWIANGHIFHLEMGKINAFLLALAVLLLEIPIIVVINKFLPFLIGRRRNQ